PLLPEFLDGLARAAVPCFERIRKVIWIRTRIEQKRSLRRRQTKHAMLKLHGRNTRKRVVLFAKRTAQLKSLRLAKETADKEIQRQSQSKMRSVQART